MTPILLFGALYGMGGLWPLRACLLEFASGGYVMVNSPSRQSNPVGSIRPIRDSRRQQKTCRSRSIGYKFE